MRLPLLVRRVREHEVIAPSAGAFVSENRVDAPIGDDRSGKPELLEVRLDHARRLAIALREDAASSPARKRLEPHRAGAREEVENRSASDRPDQGEGCFANAISSGPRDDALRRGDTVTPVYYKHLTLPTN
jgi:hypothetical protein